MKKIISTMLVLTIDTVIAFASANNDKDYCDGVQTIAREQSTILFSPQIQLQGIKFPSSSDIAAIGGNMTKDGFQVRGALAWSPLDAYKSTLIHSVADADCLQHLYTQDAMNLLEQIADIGHAQALQAQIDYLNAHQANWQDAVDSVQKRLVIGNVTLVDLAAIQQAASLLELKQVAAQGQLQVLQAKDYVRDPRSAVELAEKIQQASMQFERESSKVRALLPWTVAMSGGVVPPMASGDTVGWFGLISLTYNFGGVMLPKYENEYLSARAHELAHARYELTDQLRRLSDVVKAGAIAAQQQIAVLDRKLATLNDTRKILLDHPDAPNLAAAKALVEVQIMDAESDRVFAMELRNQLFHWR